MTNEEEKGESQWEQISIYSNYDANAPLLNASIHYAGTCYLILNQH